MKFNLIVWRMISVVSSSMRECEEPSIELTPGDIQCIQPINPANSDEKGVGETVANQARPCDRAIGEASDSREVNARCLWPEVALPQ
jgi:hypothetical protein